MKKIIVFVAILAFIAIGFVYLKPKTEVTTQQVSSIPEEVKNIPANTIESSRQRIYDETLLSIDNRITEEDISRIKQEIGKTIDEEIISNGDIDFLKEENILNESEAKELEVIIKLFE